MPVSSPLAVCFGEGLVVLVPSTTGPLEQNRTFHRSLAGAEWNAAIALVSADTRTAVISRVGDDGFGRFLVAELERHGVDTSAVEIDPNAPTGLYVKELLPQSDGSVDSAMHYYRAGSAAAGMTPEILRSAAASALLAQAALLHTSGITPALSAGARAAQDALFTDRPHGGLLSFDVNWRPALWRGREDAGRALLANYAHRADILFCTAPDAEAVFGVTNPAQLRAMFPEPRHLIVTSSSGAIAYDGADYAQGAALDTPVVETVGAGDAFAAGFLAGILSGLSLAGCLSRAHRIATRALVSTRDHVD